MTDAKVKRDGNTRRERKPLSIGLLVMLGLALAGCWLWSRHDFFSMIALGVGAVAGWIGWRSGIVWVAAMGIALLLIAALAPDGGKLIDARLAAMAGKEELVGSRTMSWVISGALLVQMGLLARIVVRWLAKHPVVDFLNQTVGMAFGLVEAALLVLLIGAGCRVLEPVVMDQLHGSNQPIGTARGRWAADYILLTSQATRTSLIGPVIDRWNPLEKIPAFSHLDLAAAFAPNGRGDASVDASLSSSDVATVSFDPSHSSAAQSLHSGSDVPAGSHADASESGHVAIGANPLATELPSLAPPPKRRAYGRLRSTEPPSAPTSAE